MAASHGLQSSPEAWRRLVAAAALLLAPALSVGAETRPTEDYLDAGRSVYEFYCYQCHAYAGNARTLASTYLEPKPRNFAASDPATLTRQRMIEAISEGRPGTAMVSFANVLQPSEIEAVVDFIRIEFMQGRLSDLIYHTAENGWANHDRYADAFPFASGELALDTAWDDLTPSQQNGKRLFMNACISCHDRARVNEEGPTWELRALSYPRDHYDHTRPDRISGASPYALHDVAPQTEGLSPRQQRGARLFQENCAFCHAADGTGRNWIGSFLEPRPRDLTSATVVNRDAQSLRQVIREGLPDTSMPAWKDLLDDEQIADIIAYLKRQPASSASAEMRSSRNETGSTSEAPRWQRAVQ